LIEPGKLDFSINETSNGGAVNFLDGQSFFWQNELLTSSDHAAADYKAIDLLPKSGRNWTCDGNLITEYPFWRFGTYHYYSVQSHTAKLPRSFNWVKGIEKFKGSISLISGSCGALGEDFQSQTNLISIPNARHYKVEGAGHISLFTTYADKTIETVRESLK
jgi:proline iminopeptidase